MPPQTRGAAKRARFMNAREQALAIVVSSGFLHWYEAVKLGETCKAMQYEWQEKKDHICEPLLASLEELKVSTNICQCCQKISFPASERQCRCSALQDERLPLAHLDPRFNEECYLQLSTWKKCQTMADFMTKLVFNFRSNLGLENSTQSVPFPFNFDGNNPGLQFLEQEMPRRFAFLIKLFLAISGQYVLYGGNCRIAIFNRAFAENTGFAPTLSFVTGFAASLNTLHPWTNHIFDLVIHQFRDEGYGMNLCMELWEVLGPVLTRKLDFFAIFVNENGNVLLPGDMELISNEQEERIRGMVRGTPT